MKGAPKVKFLDSRKVVSDVRDFRTEARRLTLEANAIEGFLAERAATLLESKGVLVYASWLRLSTKKSTDDTIVFDKLSSDGGPIDSYTISRKNFDLGEIIDEEAVSEKEKNDEWKEHRELERLQAKYEN
jgi:hypothetical protein